VIVAIPDPVARFNVFPAVAENSATSPSTEVAVLVEASPLPEMSEVFVLTWVATLLAAVAVKISPAIQSFLRVNPHLP
jgi:hypothetical protein